MSAISDCDVVARAIRQAVDAAGLSWPPVTTAPVPLDRLIAAYNLVHAEVPELTRAAAAAFLAKWGVHRPRLLRDATPLAGFLFANQAAGCILISSDDGLPRRRFSAAHELGHYLLHFLPRFQAEPLNDLSLFQDDERGKTIVEDDNDGGVEPSLPEMERQANRFAAELLMPAETCRRLYEKYAQRYLPVARFLVHQLSSDLLVSRDAARWRLRDLGLINGKQGT